MASLTPSSAVTPRLVSSLAQHMTMCAYPPSYASTMKALFEGCSLAMALVDPDCELDVPSVTRCSVVGGGGDTEILDQSAEAGSTRGH